MKDNFVCKEKQEIKLRKLNELNGKMEWWKLTAVKPRALPAFIYTRCNQQALEAG